jgi:hypothetical protein
MLSENHEEAMTSSTSEVEQFVEDPRRFDELATDYDDDVACYTDLRDEAKRTLSSFDAYLEFYAASIEHGPTEFVFYDLNRNAVRSLKNMVLRSSRAGRQFPIASAGELQRRIELYVELGVDSVTPRTTLFTIIEHILDDDSPAAHAHRILDRLLADRPANGSELVTLLARVRFVLTAESLDIDDPSLEIYLNKLRDDIPDPLPEDERTASELTTAAERKAFADPEKIELVQASLARNWDKNVLQEYLYLTACDTVERYRHQERDDPWRGELQVAIRQYNCLENIYGKELDAERTARIRSYRRLALAELESGGRWRSLRDSNDLPEPNFLSAGNHYFNAAEEIKSVDAHRYVKYLSKAFRNHATAARHRELGRARGWHTTRLIHDRAIDILTQHVEYFQSAEPDINTDSLTETIIGAVGTHESRKHRAAAAVAFEHRTPEKMGEHLDEAWDHLDAIPTYEPTDLLETLRTLSEALLFETQELYEEATDQYQGIQSNIIDIEKRTRLVEIKLDITQENYQSALETAETTFDEGSPIRTAVQIIVGESSSSPRIQPPLFEGLSAVDPETKWWFTMLTYLNSKSTQDSEFMQNQIKELLLDL